ncbi:diaminopimelate epimerase [Deltaproteobacteria bacterium TL4]
MEIKFIKCHGSGNDFVMVDENSVSQEFSPKQWSQLAIAVSDRQGLIGADGLLIVSHRTSFEGRMIMYNTDGTEAEMCGNGMRCVARKLLEEQKTSQLRVEAKVGSVLCQQVEAIFPQVPSVSVVINPVKLKASEVPLEYNREDVINLSIPEVDAEAKFTALSIPNPHLITFVPEIDRQRLELWGRHIVQHPEIFPNGMNVSMVKLMAHNHIFVMTNERGCGITQACGTAMSASAFVSCLLKKCDYNTPIKVQAMGGLNFCTIVNQRSTEVILTGNASYVYKASLVFDSETGSLLQINDKDEFRDEITHYQELMQTLASF